MNKSKSFIIYINNKLKNNEWVSFIWITSQIFIKHKFWVFFFFLQFSVIGCYEVLKWAHSSKPVLLQLLEINPHLLTNQCEDCNSAVLIRYNTVILSVSEDVWISGFIVMNKISSARKMMSERTYLWFIHQPSVHVHFIMTKYLFPPSLQAATGFILTFCLQCLFYGSVSNHSCPIAYEYLPK